MARIIQNKVDKIELGHLFLGTLFGNKFVLNEKWRKKSLDWQLSWRAICFKQTIGIEIELSIS